MLSDQYSAVGCLCYLIEETENFVLPVFSSARLLFTSLMNSAAVNGDSSLSGVGWVVR